MNKKAIKPPYDPFVTSKSKLVKLILNNYDEVINGQARFYFQNDGQLDDKIITAVVCHAPKSIVNTSGDITQQSVFNAAPFYGEYYFGRVFLLINNQVSFFYLSLCAFDEIYYWNRQPIASLYQKNTGKYIKKTHNRIKLDKCYVETPISQTLPVIAGKVQTSILFTFYYIDQPKTA